MAAGGRESWMLDAPTDRGGSFLDELKKQGGPTQRGFTQLVPHSRAYAGLDDDDDDDGRRAAPDAALEAELAAHRAARYKHRRRRIKNQSTRTDAEVFIFLFDSSAWLRYSPYSTPPEPPNVSRLFFICSDAVCFARLLLRGLSLVEMYQQKMASEGKQLKGGKAGASASGLDLGELMGSGGSKAVTAHDLNGMVADAKALDSRFSRQVTRQFM